MSSPLHRRPAYARDRIANTDEVDEDAESLRSEPQVLSDLHGFEIEVWPDLVADVKAHASGHEFGDKAGCAEPGRNDIV